LGYDSETSRVQSPAASVPTQLLTAGLLDKIQPHLVSQPLGEGRRLFEQLRHEPVELEITRVIEAPGVTRQHQRVAK
jgi:hypothetical protein